MLRKHILQGLFLILICTILFALPVAAQAPVTGLRAYPPDLAQFPTVHVRVAPLGSDGTMVSNLDKNAFKIYEDGVERPVEGLSTTPAGSQVAIILDASGSINQPGATKATRCEEAKQAIEELLMTDTWFSRSKALDRLMLVVPKSPTEYEVRQTWTKDYVATNNKTYEFDCSRMKTDTPLYTMLVDTLALMKDAPGYENRAKYLLIFSDGVDRTSVDDITDAINRANLLEVTILGVKLGPQGTGKAGNLQRLSKHTGGVFAEYMGLDSLRSLFSVIRSQNTQYDIAYRSGIDKSGKHSIQAAALIGGQEMRSAVVEVGVTVQPPEVRIVEPASPLVIDRISDVPVDATTVEPRTQEIMVEISWPDGHPRLVQQLSYIVDGTVVATQTVDEQPFVWDFSGKPGGLHSVVVEAKDEQGLVGRSEPLQATINLQIPTPEVEKVIKEEVEEATGKATNKLGLLSAAALAIAGLALLLAAYVLIKRPQVVREVAHNVSQGIKDFTEVFIPTKGKKGPGRSGPLAYLVIINEDGSEGEKYPMNGHIVKIGRRSDLAQIVLSDQSVSKLHARIEEENGMFRIFDEYSSGGTYVNYQLVPSTGLPLGLDDEIELGRVQLRFKPQAPSSGKDVTEPYVPVPKGKSANKGAAQTSPKSSGTPSAGSKTPPTDPDETTPM